MSSWSAAKVLGTFSGSNSLRRLQSKNVSPSKEEGHVEDQASVAVAVATEDDSLHGQMDHEHLERCEEDSVLTLSHEKHIDNQIHSDVPERFIGPHGGLLDVEDVEVATLLANHLTSEPSLPIYQNATGNPLRIFVLGLNSTIVLGANFLVLVAESFLTYSNLHNQLVISDSTDTLTFGTEDGKRRLLDQVAEVEAASPTPDSTDSLGSKILSQVQTNTVLKTIRSRKVHPCPNDGCKFQGNSLRDLTRHMRKHTGMHSVLSFFKF